MRIIVTGGGGFIGSHLCEALLADGHEVTAIDNFLTGNRNNIAHLHENPRFRLVEHDIVQPFDKDKLPKDVGAVFHLASPASPADFVRLPLEIAMINSRGVVMLIDPLITTVESGGQLLSEAGYHFKIPVPIEARDIPRADVVMYTHADDE